MVSAWRDARLVRAVATKAAWRSGPMSSPWRGTAGNRWSRMSSSAPSVREERWLPKPNGCGAVRAQHGVVLQSVSSRRRQASRAARAASLGWVVPVIGGGRKVMLRNGASSAPAKQSACFPSSCFPFSVAVAERAEPTISAIVLPLVLVDFLFSDFAPAPTATPSATSTPSRAIAAISIGSSGCPRRLLVLGLRYCLGCPPAASSDALFNACGRCPAAVTCKAKILESMLVPYKR